MPVPAPSAEVVARMPQPAAGAHLQIALLSILLCIINFYCMWISWSLGPSRSGSTLWPAFTEGGHSWVLWRAAGRLILSKCFQRERFRWTSIIWNVTQLLIGSLFCLTEVRGEVYMYACLCILCKRQSLDCFFLLSLFSVVRGVAKVSSVPYCRKHWKHQLPKTLSMGPLLRCNPPAWRYQIYKL